MSTLEIIFLVVVLVCILLSGYFSATETAFTAINKIRLRAKAEDGDKGAKRVLKLADNYDRLLTTILIGNNIVNILASSPRRLCQVFRALYKRAGLAVDSLYVPFRTVEKASFKDIQT